MDALDEKAAEAKLMAAREAVAREMERAREHIQTIDDEARRLGLLHERLILVGVRAHAPSLARLTLLTEDIRRLGRDASDLAKALARSFETISTGRDAAP